MKKFFDEFFKPYLFPAFLIVLGSYLKVDTYLNKLTDLFSYSSNSFIKFFSKQISLWQIILYFVIAYLVSKLYRHFVTPTTKQEKKMLKAIKKSSNFHNAVFDTGDKFTIKFKLSVLDENYVFDKLVPYCTNCSSSPIMMSKYGYGAYICNCGKSLDYNHIKFIQSRILTDVEKFEK